MSRPERVEMKGQATGYTVDTYCGTHLNRIQGP